MKISAVIPAYNSADYIADAVNSILRQTHPVDEIIVIDDGSIDDTEQIIRNFPADIRYIKQENKGPSAARNQGIKLAKGDWIAFLDADDQWTPDKIKTQIDTLARFPELRLIAGDMSEIDKENQPLTQSVLAKHQLLQRFQTLGGAPVPDALAALLHKNFIPTGTVLVWRKALLQAGLFNENIRFGEDLELWAKIAAHHPLACLPDVLMLRRQHGNNATQMTERMLEDLVKVMQSLKHAMPVELKAQQCNATRLVANSFTDLGYWYFSQSNYPKARAACLASMREKPSIRALIYLTASLLPLHVVDGIKAIKQVIS